MNEFLSLGASSMTGIATSASARRLKFEQRSGIARGSGKADYRDVDIIPDNTNPGDDTREAHLARRTGYVYRIRTGTPIRCPKRTATVSPSQGHVTNLNRRLAVL